MSPRPDYNKEEYFRFQCLPNFPLDCKNWDEFVQKMQSKENTLFFLRLMRLPHHQELVITRRGVERDKIIFGRLANRSDGRIGQLCFGEFIVMDGAEKKRRLKLVDGLGKEELHPVPEGEIELLMQLNNPFYRRSKISELCTKKEEVEERLLRWLEWRIGNDVDTEDVEDLLTRGWAADMKMVRFITRQIFPGRADAPTAIMQLLERMDRKFGLYLNKLQEQIKSKEADIRALKEEIASLE